jgi:urease accessory protein
MSMLPRHVNPTKFSRPFAALFFGLCAAAPALAHPGGAGSPGFASGFAHPFTGLDHMLAMIAVGAWAAQLGGRAIWAIPATFIVTMLAGAGLGMWSAPMPFVEAGIAVSVLVLGLAIATAFRAPLAAGACLAGIFALFHGHAHGHELAAASAYSTMLGFTFGTAVLHLIGLGLGLLIAQRRSAIPHRIAGGLIAAIGCMLLTQVSLG